MKASSERSHIYPMSMERILGNLRAADGVGVRAEPNGLGWLVIDHMTDGSASAGDIGETDDRMRFVYRIRRGDWGVSRFPQTRPDPCHQPSCRMVWHRFLRAPAILECDLFWGCRIQDNPPA